MMCSDFRYLLFSKVKQFPVLVLLCVLTPRWPHNGIILVVQSLLNGQMITCSMGDIIGEDLFLIR